MSLRVRLKSLALIIALAAAGAAAIAAAPKAHADPVSSFAEFPIPGGSVLGGLTTGPDGNLWWTSTGFINTMSPSGGAVTQYAAANVSFASAITAGSDGALWFTATPDIGRITTAGAITYFTPPAGKAGYRLQSIAGGPDGNLWFVYSRGDGGTHPIFGSITTGGAVTTYTVAGLSASLATQIVAGPGGRMWWVDRNFARISSFDPTNPLGTLTSFDNTPYTSPYQPFSGLNGLAAGSDGNIWYAHGDGTVGRLTPSGTVTLFPVGPNDNGFPNTVTLGPDGNIWFNRNYNGSIYVGRIKPDGTATSFNLTNVASSNIHLAVTAGSDGNLWFIERNGAHIGRISPNSPAEPPTSVLNLASGFSNSTIRTAGPGSTVRFVFTGPTAATVTDTTGPGLSLFDSGSESFVATYPHTYDAAGTYAYADAAHPTHTGTVEVPPTISPNYIYAGGRYVVQWADGPPLAGFEYDVQRQDPGGVFADYLMATTIPSFQEAPFSPAGSYLYRARLHRISDDIVSGWSPAVGVRYGSGTPAAFDGYPSEFSVFRPDTGGWYYGATEAFFGLPGDQPVPADYDGNGSVDRAVYRPDVGGWYLDDGGPTTTFFGLPGDLPVPADYTGDGKADISVFRPDIGGWYLHPSEGGPDTLGFLGLSGDVPVPADYDGDGKADLAVFRPSTGAWYIHPSGGGPDVTTYFGLGSDVPVPGDYDGDNKTDVAVFRPSTGVWYIRYSSGAPDSVTIFGTAGDIPAPGDYDADGRTDLAVFRPSTDAWYVRPSGGGPDSATSFGLPGDIPLPLPTAIEKTYFP